MVVSGSTLSLAPCHEAAREASRRPAIRRLPVSKEHDETGGDGGGIPARQVVARTRYRHCVDFWNPLLQQIGDLKEYRQCIAAAHRQHRVSNIFQAFGCDIPALHRSEFDLKERVDIGYRAVERTRR